MSEVKHTPGPWHVEHLSPVVGVSSRKKGGYSYRLATCPYWTLPKRGQPDRATALANAHLIAAAPALIEALEEARTTLSLTRTNIMVEIGRCADPSESRWEGVPELLKERLNQIDAALSLAKGGQA